MKKKVLVGVSLLSLVLVMMFLFIVPTYAYTVISTPFYSTTITYNGQTINIDLQYAYVDSPLTSNAVSAVKMSTSDKTTYLAYYSNYVANEEYAITQYFSNASKMADPTEYYNCHSYAWLCDVPSSNSFWIDNPAGFYQDGSYIEVSTPTINDIVCYYYNGENIHSAIIVGITSSNYTNLNGVGDFIVKSKWGSMGLYMHNAYECPYTYYSVLVGYNPQNAHVANTVKYYRRVTPIAYSQYNLSKHMYTCGWGHTHYESHTWTLIQQNSIGDLPQYFTMYECTKCGEIKFGNMA